MAEENQVMKEPQQVTQVMKEPQQAQRVTTKNLKKVEVGKRLAAHNGRRRDEQRKEQVKLEKTACGVNQYYRIGAVIALGVIGGLGCYIYQSKKEGRGEQQPSSIPQQNDPPQTNKCEMD